MGTTKKTASVYGKRIFKIEVTAIYNEDMEAEQIADELSEGLFNSLKKNGKRLVVLNVDSVKVPSKPDDVAMGIIRELSRQKQESMSMQETEEGSKYVVVEKKEEESPKTEVKQEVPEKEMPKQEEPKQEEPKKEEPSKEIEKEIPEKEKPKKEAPKKKPAKKTAPKKKLPEPEQDVKKAEPVKETVQAEAKQEPTKSFPKTKIHPIGIPKKSNASADTRPTLNDIFGLRKTQETKETPKPNAVAKKGRAVKNEKRA